MKKKFKLSNRILSIVLAFVMVIGLLPMTAFAAPIEAEAIPLSLSSVRTYTYSDNLTLYSKHNNYLYKEVYSNLKPNTEVRLAYAAASNPLLILTAGTGRYLSRTSGKIDPISISDLPTQPGKSVNIYPYYVDIYCIDKYQPVLVVTCMAVDDPAWTWNGTSSATARFTSTDGQATMTVNATITSSTQPAANCLANGVVTYTATATCNGQTYTTTKTVAGNIGPHDIEIDNSSEDYTITANCRNVGCPSGTNNSVTLNIQNEYYYTGSPIPDPVTGGFNHNMATYKVTYQDQETLKQSGNRPSAVGSYEVELNVFNANGVNAAGFMRSFVIKYLDAPSLSAFGVSGETCQNAGTYWFVSGATATVTPPEGYKISKTLNGTYEDSVSFDKDDSKTVHLKSTSNGAMTDAIDLSDILKWDTTAPTGRIQLSTENFWTKLANKVSFGKFFKSEKTATITAQDTESGVQSVQYYVANSDLIGDNSMSDAAAVAKLETAVGDRWQAYSDAISLPLNGKYIVYAKITDNVGNVSYVSSEGIVLYTDATSTTTSLTTTYMAGESRDIFVALNGNTVNEVKCNNTALLGTDYTVSSDKITLNADYLDTLAAGEYTITISLNPLGEPYVSGSGNKSPNVIVVSLTVDKATYDMTGAKWVYNGPFAYDGQEHTVVVDGLPGNLTASYTGNKATDVGDYTAKATIFYDSNNYYEPVMDELSWAIVNNWTPTEYTVSGEGWMNQDFVIKAADGYLISLNNTANGGWKDSLTYSEETNNGSVTFYLKNETDGAISLGKTVNYKIDKTVPTGRVEFEERNGWETFLNTITFGLFYKDEVNVKVTANDNLSDVAKIEYASSNAAKTLNEVKDIADWTEYNGSFGVTKPEAEKFVYFIRITDNAGNVTYLSTDGAQYDTTAPVISGIENGKTYYTTQKVTITDKNLATITFNGEPATENITLDGNKEATYTIVATDKAGNITTVTVTMKPISDLSAPIDSLTKDNVNSSNEGVVDGVIAAVEAIDTTNATETEKKTLSMIVVNATALKEVIDNTKAEIARINEELNKYDSDTVTSDDKADLEQLLADIEKQLESTNLTEEEISELNGNKKAVEDLLTKIKGTDELIDKLTEDVDGYNDDTVKSTDKDAIEQIIEDIDALLETENLTEDERKALEDTKEKAEGLLDTIEDAAEATDTENTEKVKDITAENVTPEDKTDLEKAKEDLEKALEDNSGNYTEDEKKAIKEELGRIDDALEVIGNVEAALERIDKLPDTITKDDEAAIKAADDAYNALSDYEKSLVGEDAKKALDDAKAALAELNKPNSPAPGDNSNMFLWIALLFISVGAVIILTIVDRKRKAGKR